MYKTYIETKHESRDRLGPSEILPLSAALGFSSVTVPFIGYRHIYLYIQAYIYKELSADPMNTEIRKYVQFNI